MLRIYILTIIEKTTERVIGFFNFFSWHSLLCRIDISSSMFNLSWYEIIDIVIASNKLLANKEKQNP